MDPEMMPEAYAPMGMDSQMQPGPAGESYGYDNVVPMVPQHVMELRQRVITLTKLVNLDNCAEVLSEDERAKIGSRVVREYKLDRDSRSDWEARAQRAMDLAKQKKEPKSFPWPDASNVKYPLLTTAALQFAARAYPAIVDGPRVVKCRVIGDDPDGKLAELADEISEAMSSQLLNELPNWEDDLDTALHQIPIIGCAFKKVYPDKTSGPGYRSEMISAFDLVVNQKAKSLETVPRISHVFTLYPHEIGERRRSGWFLDIEIKGTETGEDEDAPETFIEQHRWLDLDGDGTPEPWVVTVHESTEKLVRIKPCFDPGAMTLDQERGRIVRIPRHDYFVLMPFIPDPEGGFYPVGFGHLLEPISDVIDTTLNQMMDSGTLQNAGGGFIGAGVDIGKGKAEIKLRPGEYKRVQSPGTDLRQAIVNMEHPGPSPTLFQLLGMMVDAGKEVASIKDVLVGDQPGKGMTATGTMALIEQGLKVFTAIYKRIYRALAKEFKLIYDINAADYPEYQQGFVIMPVSDPGMITDLQRMSKAQFVLEEAKSGNPHIDMLAATRRAFEAARIERPEELLKQAPPPDPLMQAGAAAEVDLKAAQAEKARAETDKVSAEAVAARAAVSLPMGIPIPIPQPDFVPDHLAPMPEPPPPMGGPEDDPMMGQMPPEMMGGEGGEGAPPMQGDPYAMGAPPMMPDQEQNPLMGLVPELAEMPQDEVPIE
jgi:chaperonin GroES